jgi:hypothetical protein
MRPSPAGKSLSSFKQSVFSFLRGEKEERLIKQAQAKQQD